MLSFALLGAALYSIYKKMQGEIVYDAPIGPVKPPVNNAQTIAAIRKKRGNLSLADVRALADYVVATYRPFGVTAGMLVAMAFIESTFNTNATRYEPKLVPPDTSYGLLQVLSRTALWLQNDIGRKAYPIRAGQDLFDPLVGMYFGAMYLDWLTRSYGGTKDQVIRRYNGGPNGDKFAQTADYLSKFKAAERKYA